MSKRRWLRAPASLLGRTNLILAVSASLIVIVSIIALYTFVINPITQRSADDEAALMALSAQTWVELPPSARPYFELELAQNHDLIISEAAQDLPQLVDPSSATTRRSANTLTETRSPCLTALLIKFATTRANALAASRTGISGGCLNPTSIG